MDSPIKQLPAARRTIHFPALFTLKEPVSIWRNMMLGSVASGGFSPSMMPRLNRQPPDTSSIANDLLAKADVDGDGAISESEFSDLFQNSKSVGADSISDFFSAADSDGDGSLSLSEIENTLNSFFLQSGQENPFGCEDRMMMPPSPPGGGAEHLIGIGDTDGNGALNSEEFTAALSRKGGLDEARIAEMFSDADANSDGEISQSELESAMEQHRAAHQSTGTEAIDRISKLVESMLARYKDTMESGASSFQSVASDLLSQQA